MSYAKKPGKSINVDDLKNVTVTRKVITRKSVQKLISRTEKGLSRSESLRSQCLISPIQSAKSAFVFWILMQKTMILSSSTGLKSMGIKNLRTGLILREKM